MLGSAWKLTYLNLCLENT
ncbi:hypothetical protein LINPERPRIM_LOCUS35213 [Linum perenne]